VIKNDRLKMNSDSWNTYRFHRPLTGVALERVIALLLLVLNENDRHFKPALGFSVCT
jgi:hypothetical protein